MKITTRTKDGVRRIRIDGEMSIYHAMDMHEKFKSLIHGSTELELNLGQVTELDSAGLQLLCALKREASQAGVKLRIIEHSAAVIDVIDTYQLAGFFGDPILLSAQAA